jgi:hypothetical protein
MELDRLCCAASSYLTKMIRGGLLMKAFKSYNFSYWWLLSILLGLMAANFAFASNGSFPPFAQKACETQAKAVFKKKAVEMELASIAGNLTEIEVGSARAGLQERYRRDSENCVRLVSTRRAIAESKTGTL